jgi:precorrin-6B methylase 2
MKKPECTMEFGKDEFGKEILLKDGKFQVMMEWEKPYMEACIDALKPSGDVLEVGFGCGYSATRIQSYKPKSHTIIEYHPVVAKKAREWAKQFPNVRIVEDTWQDALDKLGEFDAIFFDDYPLESEGEMRAMEEKKDEANLILRAGKKKLEECEQTLAFLKEIKYTDQDLDQFFSLFQNEEKVEPKVILRFFFDLQDKKNISEQQLEKVLERLKEEGYAEEIDIVTFKAERKTYVIPTLTSIRGDRLFEFLDLCIKKHMRKGARFSCYLNDSISKYEDRKFFDLIITNPYLEYHEEKIPIDVPTNCAYFKGSEAVVITVTKL